MNIIMSAVFIVNYLKIKIAFCGQLFYLQTISNSHLQQNFSGYLILI
jgi:hypothetical protein